MSEKSKQNLLTISSTAQESVKETEMQIVATWKDTDKNPISKENRVRAVVLPATIWGNELKVAGENKMLRAFMFDSMEELAKDFLKSVVKDSNWMRREIPQESFTVSSLLTWKAEQDALSGRLTSDAILQWALKSKTVAKLQETKGEKIAEKFRSLLAKLAGPAHGLTKEQAGDILSKLWQIDDSDDTVGFKVQMRLEGIRDKKEENSIDDIF